MKQLKLVLCLLALIFAFASVAAAQETVEIEKTVVTATRTEKAIKDAPASVTIITREEIEATSARYVDDLLRDVVGVDVKRPRGISSSCTHIRLRGFSHPRGTLILRDGMPINRIACGGGKHNEIPVELIERIEVVRGINSSLYGTSAMGGVINIITKKPDKELKCTVEGSYGTFDTWNSGVTLSGTAKEKLGYQLYYNHLETDGYNPWSDSFIATKPAWVQKKFREAIVDQERDADNVFAKLTYEFDPFSSLALTYSYWNDDISNGRKYNYNEFERNRTSLSYEKKGRLNISASLYYLDEDFEFTYDRKPNKKIKKAFDTIEMISKIPVEDIGGMISISVPIKKRHLFTFGTDHRLGKMENRCDWKTSTRKTRTEGKQYRGSFFVQRGAYFIVDVRRELPGQGDDELRQRNQNAVGNLREGEKRKDQLTRQHVDQHCELICLRTENCVGAEISGNEGQDKQQRPQVILFAAQHSRSFIADSTQKQSQGPGDGHECQHIGPVIRKAPPRNTDPALPQLYMGQQKYRHQYQTDVEQDRNDTVNRAPGKSRSNGKNPP